MASLSVSFVKIKGAVVGAELPVGAGLPVGGGVGVGETPVGGGVGVGAAHTQTEFASTSHNPPLLLVLK